MNALNLFKSILMPHLWLNHNIGIGAATLGAAGIGAAAGLLGGGGSEGASSESGLNALPKWLRKGVIRETAAPKAHSLTSQVRPLLT